MTSNIKILKICPTSFDFAYTLPKIFYEIFYSVNIAAMMDGS